MGQGRQVVASVVVGEAGLQVDPELAGNGPVDGAGAAICARGARLFLRREPPNLDIAANKGVEGLRHLGADFRQPVLDEGEDLAPALVVVGKAEPRVLGEPLHAFANGALGIAQTLENRVHLRVESRQRVQAELVNLVGRHAGGGLRLDRPEIIFLAMRPRPHSGFIGRKAALERELGDLALECRSDFFLRNGAGSRRPISRNFLFASPSLDGLDQRTALSRAIRRLLQLGKGRVDQEGRRDQPLVAGHDDPSEFVV